MQYTVEPVNVKFPEPGPRAMPIVATTHYTVYFKLVRKYILV